MQESVRRVYAMEESKFPFPSIVIVSRPRVVKHHMAGFCSVEEMAKEGKVIYYITSYLRKSGLLHRSLLSLERGAGSEKGGPVSRSGLRAATFVFPTGQIHEFVYDPVRN